MKTELYDTKRNLIESDIGFDFTLFDRNSRTTLDNLIHPEELLSWNEDPICTKTTICNLSRRP